MKKLFLLISLLAIPTLGSAYEGEPADGASSEAKRDETPKGPSPKASSISFWSGNSSISGTEKAAEDAERSAEVVGP